MTRSARARSGTLAAALLVALLGSSASGAAGSAPVIVGAAPIADPSDGASAHASRVTFSPDGDGRNDSVVVRVRAHRGVPLRAEVSPASSGRRFVVARARAGDGVTTLGWDGRDGRGRPLPNGSYVVRVCDKRTHECAAKRVIAHLRFVTVDAPVDRAVSAGDAIPVDVATDRSGPTTLDLVSAANQEGAGVGAVAVRAPGRLRYRIPPVHGGLWLLRARNGDEVGYFPLVVHEPSLPLAGPPRGTALVVYPYLTWRAYDQADEDRDGQVDSWYAHPRRPVVPLFGPFERSRLDPALATGEATASTEQSFALWLDEHHLVAQHVTDVELGAMPLATLRRYSAIVFPDHTEYYELPTYERLLAYRQGGGRLYFLSGNSFYGRVAIRGAEVVRLSYRFRTPTRSDFRLAATGFRSCCWPASVRPRYRLAAGIQRRLPWLLAGTSAKAGDAFGLALREVDTIDPRLSPPGTIAIASATVPPFKTTSNEESRAWIGTHPIPYEPGPARARRIAIGYARTGRGEVFSWGNNGFLDSLFLPLLPRAERAMLDRVALNVWRRFTR